MTRLARLACALVLAAALPAAAQTGVAPPAPNGWMLGLRTGYAIPMGSFANTSSGTAKLSGEFSGQIPFSFDVGYRFAQQYVVGAYLELGYPFLVKSGSGLAAQECQVSGVSSCSGNASVRAGLEFLYDFLPAGQFRPWAGIGAGYERIAYELKDSEGGSATVEYSGWEFLNVQAGGDWVVTPKFRAGPYVSVSFGQYDSVGISSGGSSVGSVSIASKQIHEWLQLGVRGRFDL